MGHPARFIELKLNTFRVSGALVIVAELYLKEKGEEQEALLAISDPPATIWAKPVLYSKLTSRT